MKYYKSKYYSLLSEISTFYDNISEKYDLIYNYNQEFNITISNTLHTLMKANDFSSIADFGCGTGNVLEQLSKLDKELKLFGFDISEKSINLAKKKFIGIKNIKLFVCDWLNIKKLSMEKFDIIICIGNTLNHFPQSIQKIILKEMANLLNSNGLLIVDSYKNWNKDLKGKIVFEPRGITLKKGHIYQTCVFSKYGRYTAQRNVCLTDYEIDNNNLGIVRKYQQYIIQQYGFIINNNFKPNEFNFEAISNFSLNNKFITYKFFKLKRK